MKRTIEPGDLAEVRCGTVLYSSLSVNGIGHSFSFDTDTIVTVVAAHLGPIHQTDPRWSFVVAISPNGQTVMGWVVTTALARAC